MERAPASPEGGGSVRPPGRRGYPLAILAGLMIVWITGRVLLWESPLAAPAPFFAQRDGSSSIGVAATVPRIAYGSAAFEKRDQGDPSIDEAAGPGGAEKNGASRIARTGKRGLAREFPSRTGAALADFSTMSRPVRAPPGRTEEPVSPIAPPGLPSAPIKTSNADSVERWSLDAWAFWREGSDADAISQLRVPVYGASQTGATLQYRLAPRSRRDPRLYARAYRALVARGETEIAAGASIRPLPRVPVRFAGELRFTQGDLVDDVRPAIIAVSELPPIALPAELVGEAYAGAGYVGGDADTGFIDAQANVTREVAALGQGRGTGIRLSVGAGAWGGAQRGAERVDIGPTVRLDMQIGEVPARLSLDWRERVGGDAAPTSGIAATLSTRF